MQTSDTVPASAKVAPMHEVSKVKGVSLSYLYLFVIPIECHVVLNMIKWYLGVWIFETSLVLG